MPAWAERGVRVRVSARPDEAGHFGRREVLQRSTATLDVETTPGPLTELFDEAADYVEVVRRLWDSWEDDAEIRDAASGRFIDRTRLHYIDFRGRWFDVKGPRSRLGHLKASQSSVRSLTIRPATN